MPRFSWAAGALALSAVACSSSSYQLHPLVEGSDPNDHYIEEYETVLSYEAGSAVAVSGRREGDELVLTVAVRNLSGEEITLVPEQILVAAGDPDGTTQTLASFAPARVLGRKAAAQATKLALRAELVDREAVQRVCQATESARLEPVPLDAAGSFLGRAESPERWASAARRSSEVRNEAEAWGGHVDALSRDLLWPTTLEPGESTFGKVAIPDARGHGEYHVLVPVGGDLHEFCLLTEASPLPGEPTPVLTAN